MDQTCPCAHSNRMPKKPLALITALVVMVTFCCSVTNAQQEWHGGRYKRQDTWSPWKPPWNNFYPVVNIQLQSGLWVEGMSVPWHIEDLLWDEGFPGEEPPISEYPPWFMRRINCFLGIPYAAPPVGRLRFRRPEAPRWKFTWEAKHFRHACPQDIAEIRKDIPDYPAQNISEDCLYMNIFVPNISRAENNAVLEDDNIYPVLVYIHGGRFQHGTAQKIPGHVLATQKVVVVTFNYRLGALGFLSTEDEYAQGNWGMFDQHQALKFIKENIRRFRGDPNQITLMGDGAGAASVGLHMVSPISRNKNFYHRTILMSGTDLSSFAFVEPFWRPREYAEELAGYLGCPTGHSYDLIQCLRDNNTLSWQRFRDAQERVKPKDGALGIVWAPVQDGMAVFSRPTSFIFLPESPADLRRQNLFEQVPSMIGLDTDAGAETANRSVQGLEGGLFDETMRDFFLEVLKKWKIIDIYRPRAMDAVNFQYTYWPDPFNRTAKAQVFIDMVTDIDYGTGMDSVIKAQSRYQPNYVYEFKYKSWHDWVPKYMGTCCSAALPYVFGFPFMNETVLNETEMVPRQWFDYDDRNMSEWMMYMWTNFVKYGEPTPNITRNITWEPYNPFNLSYVVLDWHSHIWFRYRQDFYGFWKDYFPSLIQQDYLYPTATPTPAGYEYVIATGSMTTLLILLLCGVGILAFLLWHQKERERLDEAYREAGTPLGVLPHSTTFSSQSSLSTKRSLGGGAATGGGGSAKKPFDLDKMLSRSREQLDPYDTSRGAYDTGDIRPKRSRQDRSFDQRHDRSYDPRQDRSYDPRHDRSYDPRHEQSFDPRDRSYDPRDRSYDPRDRSHDPRDRSHDPRDRSYDRGPSHEQSYELGRYPGRERGHSSRAYEHHPDNGTQVSGATQHHTMV